MSIEPLEHHVAVAPPGRWLVRTGAEALALLKRVVVDPRVDAHVLPDHVHVVGPVGLRHHVSEALRHWAVSRGRSGVHGPHVRLLPATPPATTPAHIRRTRRYVHLQWVHDELTSDALASPFGTLLDRLGLTLEPLVPPVAHPDRLWAYIRSHDGASSGPLPAPAAAPLSAEGVLAAVTVACRCSGAELARRGRPRSLALAALRDLGGCTAAHAGRILGVHRTSAARAQPLPPRAATVLSSLASDPRIQKIGGPLPSSPRLRARVLHHGPAGRPGPRARRFHPLAALPDPVPTAPVRPMPLPAPR